MDQLADFEPLEYYEKHLKDAMERNAEEYFDALVKRSGVDPEQNKATVARYNKESAEAEEAGKKLGSFRALKIFLIVLTVIAFLAAVILIFAYASGEGYWLYLFLGILCALLGIGLIVLLCTVIKKKLKEREERHKKEVEEANAVLKQAYDEMAPLNALFTWGMTHELILKTMPDLTLDEQLDVRRLDLLCRKYGYTPDEDESVSTVFLLSGTAEGSPFLFERRFRRTMGTKTYTGTLTIHWTTTETDSEGHVHTQHHSQTLTASVVKPAPYYGFETRLIYANEGAPRLTFTRGPQHSELLSEKEREKKVKKGGKELKERTEEAISEGKRFTELANTEFEVLFGALDRDNEVEYRLMFTPLAQQNMLDLITSDKGYGDDFSFVKSGMINVIRSEHAQNWLTDTDPARYKSYDLAASKASFISFNAGYFKSMYFDLAPVLAVPLYRMQKPAEFIYRDVYDYNYTGGEAEVLANRFAPSVFAPQDAKTETILKARPVRREGKTDSVSVTAHSFDAVDRVDYVNVYGGDGRYHAVPVPWVEYIPVERMSEMALKRVGGTREAFEGHKNGALAEFVRRFGESASAFSDGLMAFPVANGGLSESTDRELSAIFGLREAAATGAAILSGIAAVEAASDMLDAAEQKARAEGSPDEEPQEAEDASAPAPETPIEEAAAADGAAGPAETSAAPAEEAPETDAPEQEETALTADAEAIEKSNQEET